MKTPLYVGAFTRLIYLFSIWRVSNFEGEIYTRIHDIYRAGCIVLTV